ncbi:MAG: hypothetical protein R3F54_02485 [Alphaproteobacteria bacterium]
MDQAIGNTIGHFGKGPDADQPETTGRQTFGSADVECGVERRHLYAGREWGSDHPLNIRISVPLGIGRYYITLVAGKERRARARLALDRRQNPLDTPGNALFLGFIAAVATSGTMTVLYLLLAHVFGWSGRLML